MGHVFPSITVEAPECAAPSADPHLSRTGAEDEAKVWIGGALLVGVGGGMLPVVTVEATDYTAAAHGPDVAIAASPDSE